MLLKIPESETERRTQLEEKISTVKAEIAAKSRVAKEKDNATKSHGVRFLERQRLVRLEKKAKSDDDKYKIALDQVYVAHFPHDIKYLPLFRKGGERCVDKGKALFRRAVTRNRVFKQLEKGELQRVNWISEKQYKRIPGEWTTQLEQDTFGRATATDKKDSEDSPSAPAVDNRFAVSAQHEQVLKAAEDLENELDDKDDVVKKDDASSVGESSDGSDDADPMADAPSTTTKRTKNKNKKAKADESAESDGSSSSSSSSSSDSSSDSSSGDDSEDEEAPKPQESKKRQHENDDDDDDDDFLMPATDVNVFEKAKMEKASDLVRSGDKSSGWKTQRQRPGEWKPKRQRR